MWTRRSLVGGLAGAVLVGRSEAADPVRIGQATTSLSFLPVWAARALDTFGAQNIAVQWSAIPGGDPTTLAALDAGDIDLAAVGGETVLRAVGKGQPFVMVASLMSRVTLDVVVSSAVLTRGDVKLNDTLERRLAVLKGAVIGVSAVGGTQDQAARWVAAKAGLDPKIDVKVAMVGGPPALQAALENGRIDAFVLSPPEAQIAASGGYGAALIHLGTEFPELGHLPFLVLVARRAVDEAGAERIGRVVRALRAASGIVAGEPARAANAIQHAFFPRILPSVIAEAVMTMRDGVADGGRMTAAGMAALAAFSGVATGADLTEGNGWTNRFVEEAGR